METLSANQRQAIFDLVAIVFMFVVPPIFTAITFDAGGVFSGLMTATFLLPLCIGACEVTGRKPITDGFGIVALVAMFPLITVHIMGLVYVIRSGKSTVEETFIYEYTEIIELWELGDI